jgi:hypothetical protein
VLSSTTSQIFARTWLEHVRTLRKGWQRALATCQDSWPNLPFATCWIWEKSVAMHLTSKCLFSLTVGGFTGLIGASILGPRLGRFKPDLSRKSFRPHSIIPQALGVSILWCVFRLHFALLVQRNTRTYTHAHTHKHVHSAHTTHNGARTYTQRWSRHCLREQKRFRIKPHKSSWSWNMSNV